MMTKHESYQIVAINDMNALLFIEYARLYRYDHDESDLYEESLEQLDFQKQPTYVLLSDTGVVFGAISIKYLSYLEDKKRARLAMCHVAIDDLTYYQALLHAIKPHLMGVDHLYGFMPERKAVMQEFMPQLGFDLERYVWVLTREDKYINEVHLPSDYVIKPCQIQSESGLWCQVRNEAFKSLKGSETPMDEEAFTAMIQSQGHLNEGMLMLWHNEKVVGIVRVAKETEEGIDYGFIGPVAILPSEQGKGLGRMLIRAALHQSRAMQLNQAMLCVNADNARAADLYLKEGFEKNVVMICYRLELAPQLAE